MTFPNPSLLPYFRPPRHPVPLYVSPLRLIIAPQLSITITLGPIVTNQLLVVQILPGNESHPAAGNDLLIIVTLLTLFFISDI